MVTMKFYQLASLMAKLRSSEGCPWDRAQTKGDLRPYIMEEAMELIDAIDDGNPEKIREELGDLIFEVIFVARILEEEGNGTIDDVIDGIHDKMVERHPHVFGEKYLTTPDEVNKQWEQIKSGKRNDGSILDGVSESLSALVIAEKYSRKASDVGFDWEDVSDIITKIQEEIAELNEAITREDAKNIEDEIGDILFSVVNLARFLKVHPELALRKTIKKFSRRFRYIEREVKECEKKMKDLSLDELEALWVEAKDKHRRS